MVIHDDVIKWKHFPRYWPFLRGILRSPVNSPHKGQWREALMFSLICVRINGWVNTREAGDLRRYRAHCDVTVMSYRPSVDSWYLFIHAIQNCFPGTGAIVWLPRCQWNNHETVGKMGTKPQLIIYNHDKVRAECLMFGMHCRYSTSSFLVYGLAVYTHEVLWLNHKIAHCTYLPVISHILSAMAETVPMKTSNMNGKINKRSINNPYPIGYSVGYFWFRFDSYDGWLPSEDKAVNPIHCDSLRSKATCLALVIVVLYAIECYVGLCYNGTCLHYCDVTMGVMASQITSLTIV